MVSPNGVTAAFRFNRHRLRMTFRISQMTEFWALSAAGQIAPIHDLVIEAFDQGRLDDLEIRRNVEIARRAE